MCDEADKPLTMTERAELLLYRQRFGPLEDWAGDRDDGPSGVDCEKHLRREVERTKHVRGPQRTKVRGG